MSVPGKRKPRNGWDKLTPSYRGRIERTIGREAWERGDSLSAARGHSNTPEHRDNVALVSKDFDLSELFPDFKTYTKGVQQQIATKWLSWYGKPHWRGTTAKQQNDLFWLMNEYHERVEQNQSEFWQDAKNAYAGRFSAAA